MMKLLLVLVGALGVARAAVTCDECKAFVQDLASYSQSTESIAYQVQLMKDNVCPQVTQNNEQHLKSNTVFHIAFTKILAF